MKKCFVVALLSAATLPALAATASISLSDIGWSISGPSDLWVTGTLPDSDVALPSGPDNQSASTNGGSLSFSLAPGATFETSADLSYSVSSDPTRCDSTGHCDSATAWPAPNVAANVCTDPPYAHCEWVFAAGFMIIDGTQHWSGHIDYVWTNQTDQLQQVTADYSLAVAGYNVAPVPEPDSQLLFALGLPAIGYRLLRRGTRHPA